MRTLQAELVVDCRLALGEGPMWDEAAGVLHWVGIEDRTLHRLAPDGSWSADPVPDRPGCVVLDEAGRRVVAFPSGVYAEGDGWSLVSSVGVDRSDTRLNDGKVAPDGRLVVGEILDDRRTRTGRLWAVDGRGEATLLRRDVAVSNGLAWSADGADFFYIDSPSRRVRRYEWTGGPLSTPTDVVRLPNEAGFPDGMTIDDDGCLWVAIWNGGVVHRYTPEGELDALVEVPAADVTSCAFGGPELSTLFITTAAGETARPGPHDGGLFAVEPGVSGPAPWRFAA